MASINYLNCLAHGVGTPMTSTIWATAVCAVWVS